MKNQENKKLVYNSADLNIKTTNFEKKIFILKEFYKIKFKILLSILFSAIF